MARPENVAEFHADYDKHPDDRVRLFAAIVAVFAADSRVLYPGSYVDIGTSVWFDEVAYVDTDARAGRFFAQKRAVVDLINTKRAAVDRDTDVDPRVTFHHLDYQSRLPVDDSSCDLLVSLYAGFITEHCSRYVRPGGHLLVNNSHGDASMAALDAQNELVAALVSRSGSYRVVTADLGSFMVPKRGEPATVDELHETNRGIAFTKPAFAYIFKRR